MNYYLQKREAAVQKERKQYLHNLLYEKIERLPEDFVSSGELLGVDLSIPRRCLCISFVEKQEMNVGGISTLLEKLEKILPKIQGYSELCLAYREKNQLILFLPVEKDVDVGKFIQSMREKYRLPVEVTMKVGTDDRLSTGLELRQGKQKAEKSLKEAMAKPEKDIIYYSAMTYGIFVSEISDSAKWEYLSRIFQGMDT